MTLYAALAQMIDELIDLALVLAHSCCAIKAASGLHLSMSELVAATVRHRK